jgi:AcrR family transcriptional regulator
MDKITIMPSLRERKKQATRKTFRRSAVSLVTQHGLGAVTVEAIAANAELSPRTFFNYFSSKEDALCGLDPNLVSDMLAVLAARPLTETPAEALRAMLIEVLAALDEDDVELLDRLRIIRSNPTLLVRHVASWAEVERQLVVPLSERGGGMLGWYASLVVATTLVAARLAMMSWSEHEGRISLVEELASHLDVLAAGLKQPSEEWR